MAGLNHDFFLLSRDKHDYDDYLNFINNPEAILMHDDLISYIADTLKWIPCYLPRGKNKLIAFEGLNFYGPTIIKEDGAILAQKIFTLWADLFSIAPKELKLTGDFTWIEGKSVNSGKYNVIKAKRNEVVKSLRQIADFAKEVERSNGELFILHLGI